MVAISPVVTIVTGSSTVCIGVISIGCSSSTTFIFLTGGSGDELSICSNTILSDLLYRFRLFLLRLRLLRRTIVVSMGSVGGGRGSVGSGRGSVGRGQGSVGRGQGSVGGGRGFVGDKVMT